MMSKTIRISGVQSVYLDYLRQFDRLVSEDPTQNRKFVGIILEVNGHSYCAPLSSPKPKHQSISDKAPDVVKIDEGRLGIINLNNMIPILPSAIIPIDIANVPDQQYCEFAN
jgi:protein AbiQ